MSDHMKVAGAATSAAAWFIIDFSRFDEAKPAVVVWLVMSAIADVVITCVLTWYLHSHRTGFPRTDDVITRIIRLTIQTGLVTSLWAIVDVILYLSLPNNLHLLLNIPLCKLYSNSLLSTLNSRGGWGSDMSESVVIGTANGISVNVTTISEHDKVIVKDNRGPEEPTGRLDRFPRQANDSFELDEYAKSCSADVEQGGYRRKTTRSSVQMLSGISDSQNVARKVEIAQIHLSPHGKQASTSDEWSINSRSVEVSRK
ncbi:hypothetical protein FRC07_001862 [Ceratobasidium sp. 392]|nr:hypothetical protein FRC07_001862 [Ceratobasidium sp. 392]